MKPVIRCSQLPQLLACHGSRTLMALVDARQGDEGDEGSMLHWMIADRLIREQGATPPDGGLVPPDVPKGYKAPKMSEWIVDWAMRVVADQTDQAHALEVEQEFSAEFDRWILTGHIDVCSINAAATIFVGGDWKTGYKPVAPAELNDQFLGYLVLAKFAWPAIEHAKFFGAQPRNCEEDGFQRVSTVELSGDQLSDCVTSLNDRVEYALAHAMELNSGPLQCAWCPVGIQCPSIQAEISLMKTLLTPESLSAIKGAADDATLGDIIIASRSFSKALEDAEDLLKDRIKAQGVVTAGAGTRITLKERPGQYKITNPEGAWAAVTSLVPAARLPQVVKYQKDRLIDEIAKAANVPNGGNAETTGTKIFDAVVRPNMEQGTSEILVFSP